MNKNYLKTLLIVTLFALILFPTSVFAQLFGADDEDLSKIEFELKKFNTHLENLKDVDIKSLKVQQEDLLRQIEDIKQFLPQLLGVIDNNQNVSNSVSEKIIQKLDAIEERLTVF
jgi:peptidoglycan hydrolase CwlO-like protein